ncbi:hypothetical protein [Planomonospora sp. ID82291]|uniref:hypothetical protein n=1 Tax=Planomonospora sp. ID82291 TaxID=2738136 RepID=UPI0018C36B98|nr:hypothetical protein [Planomonospora sp. ID82291]MBG0815820.1 hypothetical protein [Planomonospora sp. ID82291]
MKLGTVRIRPLIATGAVLAALAAAVPSAQPGPGRTPELRLASAAWAPPEGAYWHTRVLWTTTHPRRFGGGPHKYRLTVRELSEDWSAPDGRSWTGWREPGVYPAGAADRQAWRRDGSPKKWTRTADGQVVSLSTRPDKGHVGPVPGDDTFLLSEQRLTYDEIQRLPADPGGLTSWLARVARVEGGEKTDVDDFVTGTLTELLFRFPAPKEVRAAAYRALRTMPGVRVKGTAKDGAGRTGTLLSIRRGTGGTVVRGDLIVDTATMLLLAEELETTDDGKPLPEQTGTRTVLQAGWTDAGPAVPALPWRGAARDRSGEAGRRERPPGRASRGGRARAGGAGGPGLSIT